jgi:hypothetical protein
MCVSFYIGIKIEMSKAGADALMKAAMAAQMAAR